MKPRAFISASLVAVTLLALSSLTTASLSVAGESTAFLTTAGAFAPTFSGGRDGFAARLEQSGACSDDGLEENDTCSTAPPLTAGTYPNLQICSGDDDYYAVDLEAGETIRATITFLNFGGDLDMYLVGPGCRTRLRSSTSNLNFERIEYTTVAAATYTLQVFGFGQAENSYDLDLEVLPPGAGCVDDNLEENDTCGRATLVTPDIYPNLQICRGDDDWFGVNV